MNIFKNIKFWIAVFLFLLATVATIGGYVALPDEVKKCKTDIEENETGLQKLSTTIEKYIAVQSAVQEGNEQRQQMLEQIIIHQSEQSDKKKKRFIIF